MGLITMGFYGYQANKEEKVKTFIGNIWKKKHNPKTKILLTTPSLVAYV